MALRHSTGLRMWLITTGLDTAFDTNGRIAFYAGASPATADTAPTGSQLAVLTLSSNAFTWAACSTCATANAITSACATASGTVSYFVIYNTNETTLGSNASFTDKRLLGNVGLTSSGSDMTFDNTTWTASGTVNVTSFIWQSPS